MFCLGLGSIDAALAVGKDEELMKSPMKRKKRIEYLAEKLLTHNIVFLGKGACIRNVEMFE